MPRRPTAAPGPGRRAARRFVLCAGLLCVVLGPVRTARAQEVPPASQAPILLKLLTYDRALSGPADDPLLIGILVHAESPASRLNGAEMGDALDRMADKTINGRRFSQRRLEWNTLAELETRLRESDVDVLYVAAGQLAQLEAIRTLTRELDILSLGAESRYVSAGVSIGLGLAGDRPQILVHLESLHQEGHPLDARILRLCKVVSEP